MKYPVKDNFYKKIFFNQKNSEKFSSIWIMTTVNCLISKIVNITFSVMLIVKLY